jgi:Peptidase_C39 like family
MTEKVLAYDSNLIPQETGYWCGPASAQMCLNIAGIYVPESTLAAECGTHEGGTDWVGMIEVCLDSRLPDAHYTSVGMNHDPPTGADRDALWDGAKRSIDAGYGFIMNWVAPPGNYPVGVKGSASPGYSGTIYHYVSCAGYDDEYRALYILDSGFWPWEYWIDFDQAASLIPPKAFCYADIPALEESDPMADEYSRQSFEQLAGPNADDGAYGWPQLGGRTIVDALAAIGSELEIPGFPPAGRQSTPEASPPNDTRA